MKFSILAAAVTASLCAAGSSFAAPVTFFGQDLAVTNTEVAHANADGAQASFLAALQGVGTADFETATVGPIPPAGLALAFQGAGTATLTGTGSIAQGSDGGGRYAISGNKYYNASTNTFTISFDAVGGIAAFGFYGVDVGDYGGTLSLSLTDTNNVVTNLVVPLTVGNNGSTNGNVLYFGFYDTATQYTSISFGNASGGGDVFAFDDMTIGVRSQVQPVPEPSALALVGLALVGLGLQRRRKAA